MAIKPPNWAKHAVPSREGWRHPRTGELLAARKLSQRDIDAYNGKENIVVEQKTTPAPQQLNEAPPNNKSLDEMTKDELESYGRQHGIELDRRYKKETLVERMKTFFS